MKPLLWKSLAAAALLAIALLGGMPVPLAALAAASLLLVTRRVRPERVFREIDWSLLVFFAGLFIVTRAAESAGLASAGMRLAGGLPERGVFGLTVIAALLSNVVSNVPAVLLLQPVVAALADPERGWLVLAMATTLAGNLTLLGSVANLIVAESARREGTQITFREYLRAGVPVTLLTLAWGALWLAIVP